MLSIFFFDAKRALNHIWFNGVGKIAHSVGCRSRTFYAAASFISSLIISKQSSSLDLKESRC